MNTINSIKPYLVFAIKKHPDKKEEIQDFYELAMTEIKGGESEDNELSLLLNSVEELTSFSYQDYIKLSAGK